MTPLVDIKPGQWALAFDQPYFLPGSDMAAWLEKFVCRGGGWDSHRADEIFLVHRVETVKPKTYFADGGRRFPRENVVAAAE